MIGWGFQLFWYAIEIVLTDLLDLRYNNERSIHFIPGLSIVWSGEGEGTIRMINLTWLNLELSLIVFNLEYWLDELEGKLKDINIEEDKNDE